MSRDIIDLFRRISTGLFGERPLIGFSLLSGIGCAIIVVEVVTAAKTFEPGRVHSLRPAVAVKPVKPTPPLAKLVRPSIECLVEGIADCAVTLVHNTTLTEISSQLRISINDLRRLNPGLTPEIILSGTTVRVLTGPWVLQFVWSP